MTPTLENGTGRKHDRPDEKVKDPPRNNQDIIAHFGPGTVI